MGRLPHSRIRASTTIDPEEGAIQKPRLRTPSPALVVALIALFVALGGTSHAAIHLPKNSVGAKQLKANAVVTKKIRDGAVTAKKINTSGLSVPTADSPGELPSGKTLTGVFGIEIQAPAAGNWANTYSFEFPLAESVHASYLAPGAPPSANCPGSFTDPQAAPGYLCLYARTVANINGVYPFDPTTAGSGIAGRYGFGVTFHAAAAGMAYIRGNWAVTAP